MAVENTYLGNGITLMSGFDYQAKKPLDSRATVATYAGLAALVAGDAAYEGMLVYVEGNGLTYQYVKKENATGEFEWKEFGFNQADFDASFAAGIVDNLTSDETGKALSAAQGKVLKGLIDRIDVSLGGLTGAMHFIGVSTTDPTGESGVTIADNADYEPASGDVVIYNNAEFVFASNAWVELGDVSDEERRLQTLEEVIGDSESGIIADVQRATADAADAKVAAETAANALTDANNAASRAEKAAGEAAGSATAASGHAQTASQASAAAGNAKQAALDAQAAAEAAQDAAEEAQGSAEDAASGAATSANQAAASAGAAAASASAAAGSASAAKASEDKALEYKNAAYNSEVEASNFAADALNSSNSANESALAAEESAGIAGDKATIATNKAKDASDSASAASTSAQTASTKASEAAASAQTAGEKAAAAAGSASAASQAQTKAEEAKAAAETAKGQAVQAKTDAESAKAAAETAKSDAVKAQQAAETAQSEAKKSETNAATSATNAGKAQTAAEVAQSKAETAQAAAAGSAQTASEHAAAAAGSAEQAEASNMSALSAQGKAEAAQGKAEAAQAAAETAQGKAEDAQADAESARDAASKSAEDAGKAKTGAESAQAKAEAAQAAAEAAAAEAVSANSSATAIANAAKETAEDAAEDAAEAVATADKAWQYAHTHLNGKGTLANTYEIGEEGSKNGVTIELSLAMKMGSEDEGLKNQIVLYDPEIAGMSEFEHSVIATLDASAFIKDGMLHDVAYDAASNTLTFTWNTDAGEQKTDTVVLSDIIDPYTAGAKITIDGTTIAHDTIAAPTASAGSGRTYLTGVTTDGYGHITGYTTATESDQDLTNYKTKQQTYTANGSTVKTVTKVEQNANGEVTVTYGDIAFPAPVDISGKKDKQTAVDNKITDKAHVLTSLTQNANGDISYDVKQLTPSDIGAQPAGNYKTVQNAVVDPTANGKSLTFIDSISQNANGVITATKKNVNLDDYETKAQAEAKYEAIGAEDRAVARAAELDTVVLAETQKHVKDNYVSFSNNNTLMAGDDVIIFVCGDASSWM